MKGIQKKSQAKHLTEILITQPGVNAVSIDPHEPIEIRSGNHKIELTGPAIIIVVED